MRLVFSSVADCDSVYGMPKTKKDTEGGHGDWSATGTFLRKPNSGWLHEERELTRGAAINYSIQVLLAGSF